jgi:hypothetical protein
MRTKTFIAAAALLAAGALSSMAQSNVYSVNVVGYVNLTPVNGFQLIANQLDYDGTGNNNTVYTSVGTNNIPNGTKLYAYTGGGYAIATYNSGLNQWLSANIAAVNAALNPGGGVFLNIPAGPTPTITLVGNVMQGALTTPYNTGFQIISSKVPQTGGLTSVLGYTPVNGDKTYQLTPGGGYTGNIRTYNAGLTAWLPSQPSPAVGESFWLSAQSAGNWTRNFTVQ